MKEKGRNMLINAKATKVELMSMAVAARLEAVRSAVAVPAACGPDIAPAPARGGFVLVRNLELLPVGDRVEAVHRGYGGRAAIRQADAFDAMLAAAARRKQPSPLTHGQISIGRRYRDLVELLASDGTKLSSLEASCGGPDARDWMDRRLAFSRELEAMRRRLGVGPVMVLRRIRPSQRHRDLAPGERAPEIFTRRDLVDAVCLKGLSIKQALKTFRWSDSGRNCRAAMEALSASLDAMIGYRG